MLPRTHYVKSGGVNIAYQVTGDGSLDIVYVPGWVSNLDHSWTSPRFVHMIERLSSFSRLIRFDKRGTGLSDRNVGFPTLEERMEDLHAVMDAVGSKRAALFGSSEGGNVSMLFAATYPGRTAALLLSGCFAKGVWSEDYPWAKTKERTEEELVQIERDWGSPADLSNAAPSLANDEFERDWFASYLRNSASPTDAISLWRWNAEIDVRDILPAIHVPTLIIQRTGDRWVKVEEGRYLANHIAGAKYVELAGDDHVIWGEDSDRLVEEIQAFLTGARPPPMTERVLLTVLFTDIVGSTSIAANIGDQKWRDLLQRHDDDIRIELRRSQGTEIKTTGDGFLAAFQRPTRAIQCATAICSRMAKIGLQVRAAIHIGECEKRGDDLSGIAIHLASRLLGYAQAGEIIASRTVKDLVVGSGFAFEDRGEAKLRDVPGTWQIYSVSGPAP